MAIDVGSIVQGIGGAVNGALNYFANDSTNRTNTRLTRETNAQNKELFERQLAWQEDMWNKSNEYNDPSNQRDRLLKAGINPAFVLGNGSLSEASPMSSPSAPHMEAPRVNSVYDPSIIQNGIETFLNYRLNYQMHKEKLEQNWIDILKDTDLDPETKNEIIKNKFFKSDRRTEATWQMMQTDLANKMADNKMKEFEANMLQEKGEELRKQWQRNQERHRNEMRILVRQAVELSLHNDLLKSQKVTEDKKIEIIDKQLEKIRRQDNLFSGEDLSFRAVLEMIHDLFTGGLIGLISALK